MQLIDELSGASSDGRLREVLVGYEHPHVLVVDEVGYLAYGDDAANDERGRGAPAASWHALHEKGDYVERGTK